jgi:large subunit ribosomal protein L17
MRHRMHHRKLNRTSEHRLALRRNLAQSLIEHGRITTTAAKAKDVKPFVERLVTLAVKVRRSKAEGDAGAALRARRAIHHFMSDRAIIPADHRSTYEGFSETARAKTLRMSSGRRYRTGEPKGRLAFTAESVTHRLIETVARRFEDRAGGYTRLISLAERRVGDQTRLAVLELVGDEEAPTSLTKPRKSARSRRTDARYAMAIRVAKDWKGPRQATAVQKEAAEDSPADNGAERED